MIDEAKVIEQAKLDTSRFEPLYNKYYESIFRYIVRKTDDKAEAADLTSRVFLNAIKALPKYEFTGVPFGAWLYKIAANEVNRFYRNKKRRFLSLEDEKVNIVLTCDNIGDSEEKQAVLMQLISELKDDEISILELKFFENKNFQEIAYIMEQNESRVKMRMYRALDKLKKKFESLNIDD